MENKITKIKEAAYMAISLHGLQKYDDYPYYYHLEEVVSILYEFKFTEEHLIVAAYLHDTLEDTPISYNDIKRPFGGKIADIVYCVTDELGKDRKEKKAKTYPKIATNLDAIIIKLVDRIANMRNSQKTKHSMSERYVTEYKDFKFALYNHIQCKKDGRVQNLWNELDRLTSLN